MPDKTDPGVRKGELRKRRKKKKGQSSRVKGGKKTPTTCRGEKLHNPNGCFYTLVRKKMIAWNKRRLKIHFSITGQRRGIVENALEPLPCLGCPLCGHLGAGRPLRPIWHSCPSRYGNMSRNELAEKKIFGSCGKLQVKGHTCGIGWRGTL